MAPVASLLKVAVLKKNQLYIAWAKNETFSKGGGTKKVSIVKQQPIFVRALSWCAEVTIIWRKAFQNRSFHTFKTSFCRLFWPEWESHGVYYKYGIVKAFFIGKITFVLCFGTHKLLPPSSCKTLNCAKNIVLQY